MAQTIKLKRSATSGAVPTTSALELGEMAINTHDGKVYIKKDDGTESVVEVGADQTAAEILTAIKTVDGSGSGLDADLLDGNQKESFNPVAARYITAAGASGRLRITLPFLTNSAKMLSFKISGYGQYDQWEYQVSGYLYPSTNNWYLPKVVFTGTNTPDIQMGRDANGYAYVSIPRYNYMGVTVHSITLGYISSEANAYEGWSITNDATTAPNQVTPTVSKAWHSTNDGSGSGLDADLLDGQHGSYYAPNSSLSNYLPLSGGVITGDVSMNNTITFNTDYNEWMFQRGNMKLRSDGNYAYFTGANGFYMAGFSNLYASNLTAEFGGLDVTGTATMDGLTASGDITAGGYLQATSYLYTRNNLRVLNSAGTGWNTWGTRSNGNYNLNVGTINSTGIDVTGTATMDGLVVDSGAGDLTATFQSTDQFADIKLTDSGGSSYIRQSNGSLLLQADRDNASAGSIVQVSVDNTERMRINSSGNVGIGTSSPPGKLTISNNGAEGIEFFPANATGLNTTQHYNRSGTAYVVNKVIASEHRFNIGTSERARLDTSGNLLINKTGNNPSVQGCQLSPNGTINSTVDIPVLSGGIQIRNNSSTDSLTALRCFNGLADITTTSSTGGGHSLSISGGNSGEYARFTNAKRLGIGTTAPAQALHVVGSIVATGNITAYYSDERLKDLKGTIPNALDKVNQLNGYYYTPNETAQSLGVDNKGLEVGISAQEVEAVLPEVVTKSAIGDDYKTVWYEKLTPLLIEAVKELTEKVDKLEARLTELEK